MEAIGEYVKGGLQVKDPDDRDTPVPVLAENYASFGTATGRSGGEFGGLGEYGGYGGGWGHGGDVVGGGGWDIGDESG